MAALAELEGGPKEDEEEPEKKEEEKEEEIEEYIEPKTPGMDTKHPHPHVHCIGYYKKHLSNATGTGREMLCRNRQGCLITQCKTQRKWSKGHIENPGQITQGNGLHRCWIRQALL